MQVYSIIVTTDAELRRRLWEAHFKQPLVMEAPVHLTFCVDVNRFHRWLAVHGESPAYDNFLWMMSGAVDATLASQNVALEAENNGLGICYLGTVMYNGRLISDILQLPKGVVPVAAFSMGYPAETPELTDRLPYEAVVHDQVYRDYTDQQIKDLYREKEELESSKKLVAENGVPSLAAIFPRKRYTKPDNLACSRAYFKLIEEQGFFNHE